MDNIKKYLLGLSLICITSAVTFYFASKPAPFLLVNYKPIIDKNNPKLVMMLGNSGNKPLEIIKYNYYKNSLQVNNFNELFYDLQKLNCKESKHNIVLENDKKQIADFDLNDYDFMDWYPETIDDLVDEYEFCTELNKLQLKIKYKYIKILFYGDIYKTTTFDLDEIIPIIDL